MKAVNLISFLLALLLHLCVSAARESSLQVHPKEKVHQPIHGVNSNVSISGSRKGGDGELSLWRRDMGEEWNLKKSNSGSGGGGGGSSGGGKGVGSGGKGGEGAAGSQTTRQPRNEKSAGSLTHSHSYSTSTPLFLLSFLLL